MDTKEKIEKLKILKEQFAKKRALLAKAKLLNEQVNATNLYTLLENDLEQAKLILAARDVLDKLQKIAEHLAELGAEEIMPLADSMKGAFGPEAASTFEHAANSNIQKALETVRAAKDSINTAILQVEGKIAPQNDMNAASPASTGEMGNDMAADENPSDASSDPSLGSNGNAPTGDDPFGGAPSNSGPADEPLGRAKKESIEYKDDLMNEGKSYKYDDEDEDEDSSKESRKKSKEKREQGKVKRMNQKSNMSANEGFTLAACGSKLLEQVNLHSLMDWLLVEASKTMSGLQYTNFVRNATAKAINNPTAMAGWIGKKRYGESAMARLSNPTARNTRTEAIAEAIAKMIETNVRVFGKGRAAKVVEAYLSDTSLMEDEGSSVLEAFENMYGMTPAHYSIKMACKIQEDDAVTLTPQDTANANSAIGQIAGQMASNPSTANQPVASAMSSLNAGQRSALQKIAGSPSSSTQPTNIGQLVKNTSDALDKKPGNTMTPTSESAMQTDAGQHKANMNKPKLKTSAKTHPMKPDHKGIPLSQMAHNQGEYGENTDGPMKTIPTGVGQSKVAPLKGTNAKDTIAPNRDHMMKSPVRKVTKEAAMQTDAGKNKANMNKPKLTTSAKVHPMKPQHKGIPLNQMAHNQGEYGENTDGPMKTIPKNVSQSKVAPLKGTNAKDTIAPNRDHMMKSTVRKVTKESESKDDDGEDMGPLEAHGVKGMDSKQWRKKFKSSRHFNTWADKHEGNIEVHGTRKLGANESIEDSLDENINAANWPTDKHGQYKGTPMSTDYGKHKATTSGSKPQYKSTGPNAKPEPPDSNRMPPTLKDLKDPLIVAKGGDNQSSSSKESSSRTNAKDTVNKSGKDKVPESNVFEDFNDSYEEEILEAAKKDKDKKKGKVPPQFNNKNKIDSELSKKSEKISPKPWMDPKAKKATAGNKAKAID